jgi:DNA-binding NtrC family response regulator
MNRISIYRDRPAVWNRRRRVLLVDKPKAVTDVAVAVLEAVGYEVETAEGGAEALGLLVDEGRIFDVVAVDAGCPRLCGDDVSRLVAAVRPDVAVVVVPDVGAPDVLPAVEDALHSPAADVVPWSPPAWARRGA